MDETPAIPEHGDAPAAPGPPATPDPRPEHRTPDLQNEDVLCIQCSYNLRGLDPESHCPECGTPVARSLQGNLLEFSSDDYLASLQLGLTIILAAIAARVIVILLGAIGVGVMIAVSASSGNVPDWVSTIGSAGVEILASGIELVALWGWWLFTAPDPAVLGTNTGSQSRRFIRIMLIVSGVFGVIEGTTTIAGTTTGTIGQIAMAGGNVSEGLATLAFVAKFFAAMVYLRWLAPRLPNPRVDARARQLMWLGPLLCLAGFCLVIPFIVALVLYWNLLTWVRTDLRNIRAQRSVPRAPSTSP